MRAGGKAFLLSGAYLAALSLLGGCAPNRQAVRSADTGVAVRLPPVEAMDVRLRPNRPEIPPGLPFSVTDETRDRWLTLFEVTVSPVSAGSLPRDIPEGD